MGTPAGTPKEIVDCLAATIRKAMANDEHLKKMEEQGLGMSLSERGREPEWPRRAL